MGSHHDVELVDLPQHVGLNHLRRHVGESRRVVAIRVDPNKSGSGNAPVSGVQQNLKRRSGLFSAAEMVGPENRRAWCGELHS